MNRYSTVEVARQIGVHKNTLLRWLYAGVVPEPKRQTIAGIEGRTWTERDAEKARKYKAANYRKGRGRKPKYKREASSRG